MTTEAVKAGPATRCKFHCVSTKNTEWGAVEVELNAVYPNEADGFKHSPEDHAFFAATPQGKLVMLINNPYGAELFQPGEDFYLDITKAPKPAPAPNAG